LYLVTDEISAVLVRGQLGFLVGDGFEVVVATRLVDSAAPEPGAWDAGVRVEHVPFVREPSPLADLWALWATVRLIRRLRPDVVNASTPKAGLLGMLAARICRVPVRVYVVRGFRFETATGWRRRLFAGLEKRAIRAANHVVFNSRSLMALGEDVGVIAPGRGEVIGGGSGNGIDVARFAADQLPTRVEARAQLGVPADALVVGFVGRFTHDKGIADLVNATGTLRTTHRELHLLLVGQFEDGDPVPSDVRSAIEEGDHVTVVPWLGHTGVAYRAMDVLVFPSYREGLPNVPLEAQLCGVPVLGYAATGTVDAVSDGNTGVLVPTGDGPALTAALRTLIDDEQGRTELGSNGPAWVSATFDRQQLLQGWADRYRTWTPGP
jgi:glycosyltransferase involved in cell wall biosynthesis